MSVWDTAAATRLDEVVTSLRGIEVVEVLHDHIREVWRANLARYEPTELGDTTQSLGLMSWTDISQLVFRHYSGRQQGRAVGVRASLPYNSLLVEACGVRVQTMKAPPASSRAPSWSGFAWHESDSKTRYRAAQNNTAAYVPADSDQDGRPPLLSQNDTLTTLWGTPSDPSALIDLMLVWSGELDTGLTAGWLGMPCLGSPPWFAVAPLWWDEGGERTTANGKFSRGTDDADTFDTRPEPALKLGLKTIPAEQGK